MNRSAIRRLVVFLVAALSAAVAVQAIHPDSASAGTLRTKVFDFNACDQNGEAQAPDICEFNRADVRADAIVRSVLAGDSNVVVLQEVCKTTVNRVLSGLGSAWQGFPLSTHEVSSTRCSFPGSVGETNYWGLAIIARTSYPIASVGWTHLPEPTDESEERYFLCGTVTIIASFKVCSTHFSQAYQGNARAQAAEVGRQATDWARNNAGAILIGADTNTDIRTNCTGEALDLRPIQVGSYGGMGSGCVPGYGDMYEADQPHDGNYGPYTEITLPNAGYKIDDIYFNYQKWYADYSGVTSSSTVSDHNILRGDGTLFW
jgi:hypothetical protein